jgi:hypothetical protein
MAAAIRSMEVLDLLLIVNMRYHSQRLGKEPGHLHDGRVEDVEEKLRGDADGEHEQGHGHDDQFLAPQKIWEGGAVLGQWSAEERLHGAQENNGGNEQANHGHGGVRGGDSKRALKNKEFADESVQARQA